MKRALARLYPRAPIRALSTRKTVPRASGDLVVGGVQD